MAIDYRPYVLPLVAGALYLGWMLLRPAEKPPPTEAGEPPAQPVTEPLEDARPPLEDARSPVLKEAPTTDRKARDALRERIGRALEQRAARSVGVGKPVGADPDSAAPQLDVEYVRARLTEDLVPLAKECYEHELEKDPSLEARLDLEFTLIGDETVGSVVDSVEVTSASVDRPDLVECVRESTMSVSLVPPTGGGSTTIAYSVVFSPGEEPPAPDPR